MSRYSRLCTGAGTLLRAACHESRSAPSHSSYCQSLLAQQPWSVSSVAPAVLQGLHTSPPTRHADVTATESYGKATGQERFELEAKAKGIADPYHEDWLDAPFGTEDKPVQVTSAYEERIVGVPDPNDDSIVWWGTVHEGQPPKQILEGGEFFVLKRVPDTDAHSH